MRESTCWFSSCSSILCFAISDRAVGLETGIEFGGCAYVILISLVVGKALTNGSRFVCSNFFGVMCAAGLGLATVFFLARVSCVPY
jgi:hypothetical protein